MTSRKDEFVGTRVRLQRLSDAKMFSGWIESFVGESLRINLSTDKPIAAGEAFHLQGVGPTGSMTCQCHVIESAGLDASRIVSSRATAQKLSPQTRVSLKVSSAINVVPAKEEVRHRISDVIFAIWHEDEQITAMAVDGSHGGVGAICKHAMPSGKTCKIAIPTDFGEVTGNATLRYCRPIPGDEELYRLGFMFEDLDRINRSKWERFLKSLI